MPTHQTDQATASSGIRPASGEGAAQTCRYVPAYQTRCGSPTVEGPFCEKHRGTRCGVCGEQAVTECSHTGQFVCGTPLCDGCEGFVDEARPNGNWGFANHGHRRIACTDPTPTEADGGRATRPLSATVFPPSTKER